MRAGSPMSFTTTRPPGSTSARLAPGSANSAGRRLLNRAGTTFRKLPEADKHGLDADKAAALMLAQPSMIRRPILDLGDRRLLGFDAAEWAEALA